MTSDSTRQARRTPTDDEVPALLEAIEASGGNTAAFAREHGLAPWKLYEARRVAPGAAPVSRRRRRRGRRKDAGGFVRVHVLEEVAPAVADAPLEVVCGAGHRLLIRPGFDEATLRRVLGVLVTC